MAALFRQTIILFNSQTLQSNATILTNFLCFCGRIIYKNKQNYDKQNQLYLDQSKNSIYNKKWSKPTMGLATWSYRILDLFLNSTKHNPYFGSIVFVYLYLSNKTSIKRWLFKSFYTCLNENSNRFNRL